MQSERLDLKATRVGDEGKGKEKIGRTVDQGEKYNDASSLR